MRMRLLLVVCMAVSLFLATEARPAAESGDIRAVKGTGRATIIAGDAEGARKAALQEAKKEAVEQAGMQVISQTVVDNFELVKDRIITKAEGYLKTYRITREQREGERYMVSIDAEVSSGALIDDATLIYHDMNKPRIIVVIPEVRGAEAVPARHIENQVSEFLLSKGFTLVDQETAKANIRKDELRKIADGDLTAAAKLGMRSGAEVVVTGTATLGNVESVRGILYASKSTVSLRALRTDTAELYAAASMTESAADGIADAAQRKAAEAAGGKAARDLFWKVVRKWNEEKTAGGDIEVHVTGVRFALLKKVIHLLKAIGGVKDVQQRSFDNPAAVLTVTFEGDANRLADLVSAVKQDEFKTEVLGVSPNKLSLRVKEN